MERAADNLQRLKFLKLYRLLFSIYTIFKFWSRDYHVIMMSQNFLIWSSKCPVYQPFIWGAAIGRTFFGSLVIRLLNFGHVTTWSRDFFSEFLYHPVNAQSTNLSYEGLKYAVAALVL